MQIQMHHVEAHVARAGNAHDRIGVRSIIVQQAAGFVDNRGDLHDLRLEQAERARIRKHQRGGVAADCCFQCFKINHSLAI
ncbi:hypothetical protein D3C74_453880 [compost metagenome]